MAKATLNFTPKTKEELYNFDDNQLPEGGLAGLKLTALMGSRGGEVDPKDYIAELCIRFHADMKTEILDYIRETGHIVHVTPVTFLNFVKTFNILHKE